MEIVIGLIVTVVIIGVTLTIYARVSITFKFITGFISFALVLITWSLVVGDIFTEKIKAKWIESEIARLKDVGLTYIQKLERFNEQVLLRYVTSGKPDEKLKEDFDIYTFVSGGKMKYSHGPVGSRLIKEVSKEVHSGKILHFFSAIDGGIYLISAMGENANFILIGVNFGERAVSELADILSASSVDLSFTLPAGRYAYIPLKDMRGEEKLFLILEPAERFEPLIRALSGRLVVVATVVMFAVLAMYAVMTNLFVTRRFETLIATDQLTGLYNKRHFLDMLKSEFERSRRLGLKFSVAFFDIQDMKLINSKYSHLVGDEVLRAFALSLRSKTRKYDIPARYGPDEFAILLPNTSKDGAKAVAERILDEFKTSTLLPRIDFTVSAKYSVMSSEEAETPEKILLLAEKELKEV